MTDRSTPDASAIAATVAAMGKIGFCVSPSFSPDGARLAFVASLSGSPQIWTVASGSGWPTQVTNLDDQITGVAWSPDGAWLAFTLAPGGGMNVQVYLVRPDGSELHCVTDGGTTNNWLGPWSDDGRFLAVASNRRSGAAVDTYLIDVERGEWQLVAEQAGIGRITSLTSDGGAALVWRMLNRGDSTLFYAAPHGQTLHELTPHSLPERFDNGQFSPDGRRVYLVTNHGRDLAGFASLALDEHGRPSDELAYLATRDDAELDTYALSHDGRVAALVWNVAGQSELEFLDVQTTARTVHPGLPAQIIAGLTFSRDGRKLALTLNDAAAPYDIWVLDRETNQLSQVTFAPHAGIDLAALIRPELLQFSAHDGLGLSGWLYRPHGFTAPGPVVLSFHGGPEAQERPIFNGTYQALLAQGMAVFAPNVRGSAGFGTRFMHLDNRELRFDAIQDIEACARYLVETGVAELGRMGIMGGSYGGYMTMVGLTTFPDLFVAGANLFGIVNFETFFAHTEPWMAAISTTEYGDPETERELLQRLSPIHQIDKVKAATLVLHGANDTNVPVVEAEQVVEQLRERGIPVEYILFPDEGHGFVKTANRTRAAAAVVGWFVRYLKR